MGLGQVLSEEMRYGRNGHLLNLDLLDYKIPTVHEMPEIVPIIVESNDSEGPFGAKEAGEGPLLPILPAVCNAVYDAVGIRTSELPITPDRMYRMIEAKCKEECVSSPLDLASPRLSTRTCKALWRSVPPTTPSATTRAALTRTLLTTITGRCSGSTLKSRPTSRTSAG